MAARRALITGITGQDGSYLAELLLAEGYEVFGLTRRLSASNYWRIEHLRDRITLLNGDLLDQLSLIRALERAAAGTLQSRGHVVRTGVMGPADAHRRIQLAGSHPCPRSRARGGSQD